MKKLLIILSLLILSCDSSESCNKDECGECDGPGIERPEFNSIWDAGDVCDCEGNVWDCTGICGGYNNYGNYIDCDGECIDYELWDNFIQLGNGFCDKIHYLCEEHYCDNGDCGEWDGSQCVAGAAIKYDALFPENIYDFYSNDYSVPNSFYIDYYYESNPGTYNFEYYVIWSNDNIDYHQGYYTTYNPIDDHNVCFELSLSILSPIFYEWHPWGQIMPDCASYFGYTCEDQGYLVECEDGTCRNNLDDCPNRSNISKPKLSNDMLEEYNKQIEQYNQYLRDKERDQKILNERGIDTQNSISNFTITKIDNPEHNLSIMEIDNHPDVIVQQGEHHILKYVKKRVKKE